MVVVLFAAAPALAQVPADACRELVLQNGRIATMDARGTTASSLVIRDDRIASRSTAGGVPPHSACARVIDLRGRRVIPGLIDTHDHPSYFTARPGFDVRLDTAASIAGVQALLRARAAGVKPGDWVTSLGGWAVTHLAEKRMPLAAELDAAAPDHPVLLVLAGQGATNTRGSAWLAGTGVDVGEISGPASIAALNALRATMTFDDRKRAIHDLLAYYARMCVTTHIGNGGGWPPTGTPSRRRDGDPAPALAAVVRTGDGGLNALDPFTGYLPLVALDRERRLPGRLRLMFYSLDLTPELPLLPARLDNQMPGLGSDWRRVNGVGERVAGGAAAGGGDGEWDANGRPTPQYEAAVRLIAQPGWALQQHSTALDDARRHVDLWERVNASVPLAPLRWMLAHVRGIDRATLDRLKALRLYTIAGAWFSRDEDSLGSIEVGKLADVVVLSDDFLDPARAPDEQIKQLRSVLTIVGGRVVHEAR